MVRPKIPHAENAFYHLTLRGNRKQAIFETVADRQLFEWLIGDAVARTAVEIHAYCWMDNHVHMLARVGAMPLYRFVQHFASRYALRFNETHGTVGHLFQGRYWADIVDTDAYLLETVRYIHRNPVAASLADAPIDYPWSSHRCYLAAAVQPWLRTDFVLTLFGETPQAARSELCAFVNEARNDQGDAFTALVEAAKIRFDLTSAGLCGRCRTSQGPLARAWVAYYATRQLGLSLTDVARRLNRSRGTLSIAVERYYDRLQLDAPAPMRTQK